MLLDFLLWIVSIMSAFTFDFDLEDDLDESLEPIIILPQEPSVPPILATEGTGAELPAMEIPLSELVRIRPHIVPVQSIPHHPTRRQRSSPHSQKPSHTRRSLCPREMFPR